MPRPKDLLRHLMALCTRVVAGDSRRQIDYLLEEDRILKQALGKRRLIFTDEQRIRLADKAKAPGLARGDDVELAGKALLALPRLGVGEDEAGVVLANGILVARNSGKWGAAVAALAGFGPRARSALPQLIDQLDRASDPLDRSTHQLVDAIRKVRAPR